MASDDPAERCCKFEIGWETADGLVEEEKKERERRPTHAHTVALAWHWLGCRRRPGAQRPRHRRRARSAWRRWQPAAAPPGTQAHSALGAQRRAPSAEREAQAEIRLAAGAGRAAPTPPAPSA